MDWWVRSAYESGGVVFLGSWVFWVILSIVLHELAHGWAALRCGDPTPVESGHMTWNPIVHMGQWSLIMFALVGIAWGQMPVNPHRFNGRYDDAKVAAAGPLMNLWLFLVCAVGLALWIRFGAPHAAPHVADNLHMFLMLGSGLNLALMLFNLIPVPPLDGSRIIANFSRRYSDLIHSEHGAVGSLVAFALIFFVLGPRLFDLAFSGAIEAARLVLHLF